MQNQQNSGQSSRRVDEDKERSVFKPQRCPHCRHKFKTKSAWMTHRQHIPHTTPHRCDICHKYFLDKVSLQHHQQAKHDQGPLVKRMCVKCKKSKTLTRMDLASGMCLYCCQQKKRDEAILELFGKEKVHVSQIKQLAKANTTNFTGLSFSPQRRYRNFSIRENISREDLKNPELQVKYEAAWNNIKSTVNKFYNIVRRNSMYAEQNITFSLLESRLGADCRTFLKEEYLPEGDSVMIECIRLGTSWGFLNNNLTANQPPNKNVLYASLFNEATKQQVYVGNKRKRPVYEDVNQVEVLGEGDGKFTELPHGPLFKIARLASAADVSVVPRLRSTCKEFRKSFQQLFAAGDFEVEQVQNIEQQQESNNQQEDDGTNIAIYREVQQNHQMLFFVEHSVIINRRQNEEFPVQPNNNQSRQYRWGLYFPCSLSLFPRKQVFQYSGSNKAQLFSVFELICMQVAVELPEIFQITPIIN